MIEELTKVRNEKMAVEDKCTKLELELARVKADKLAAERQSDILGK